MLAGVAAVALALPGCAGHGSRTDRAGTLVPVVERDFRISVGGSATRTVVSTGDVRLAVHNRGPETHELLVARVGRTRLPLRADGTTVDEDAVKPAIAATVEGREPGASEQVHLHLAPGRYILFCNMAGHYLGGMHAELVVR